MKYLLLIVIALTTISMQAQEKKEYHRDTQVENILKEMNKRIDSFNKTVMSYSDSVFRSQIIFGFGIDTESSSYTPMWSPFRTFVVAPLRINMVQPVAPTGIYYYKPTLK